MRNNNFKFILSISISLLLVSACSNEEKTNTSGGENKNNTQQNEKESKDENEIVEKPKVRDRAETENNDECIYVSSENTPTGRIVWYKTPKSSYSKSELKIIARRLVEFECTRTDEKSVRIVLENKNGDQLGILGMICETGNYFGELR